MPIRLRLALLFALGTAALVAAGGFVFEQQLRTGLRASLDSALRPRADLLVRSVATGAIGSPDGSSLVPGTLSQVYNPAGQVTATSADAGQPAAALLSPDQVRAAGRGPLWATSGLTLGSGADRASERVRLRALPVARADGTWVAVVGTSLETTENVTDRVARAVLFAGPPTVVLAGIAAWLVAGAALAPVERMRRQVADISEHGGRAAIAIPGTRDEIARLGATMNAVLSRLTLALDRERQFVSDAGHELRTPLAILQGELELAGNPKRTRADLTEAVQAASAEVRRLVDLTEDLLALGQGTEVALRAERVMVAEVVDAAVDSFSSRAGASNVALRRQLDRTAVVAGDASQLRRAVENLVDNALRFAPPGSAVTVSAETAATACGTVVVEVRDDGPGFPDDFLPHAFERFRRADDSRSRAGGGTGLGLAIVQKVAVAHGGVAFARNRPEGGASVGLKLPPQPRAAFGSE